MTFDKVTDFFKASFNKIKEKFNKPKETEDKKYQEDPFAKGGA